MAKLIKWYAMNKEEKDLQEKTHGEIQLSQRAKNFRSLIATDKDYILYK